MSGIGVSGGAWMFRDDHQGRPFAASAATARRTERARTLQRASYLPCRFHFGHVLGFLCCTDHHFRTSCSRTIVAATRHLSHESCSDTDAAFLGPCRSPLSGLLWRRQLPGRHWKWLRRVSERHARQQRLSAIALQARSWMHKRMQRG